MIIIEYDYLFKILKIIKINGVVFWFLDKIQMVERLKRILVPF